MPARKKTLKTNTDPAPLRRLSIGGVGKEKRQEIRRAVEWMLPALVGKRLTGNVDLTIRFVPNLGRFVGDCEWLDDNVSPRQFMIRISTRQSLRQQSITLAHELTHLKQFVTNELFDYAENTDLCRWRSQVIDATTMAYRELPWEKDAFEMQTRLVRAYKKWCKQQVKGD